MCKLNPDKIIVDDGKPYSVTRDASTVFLWIAVPMTCLASLLVGFNMIKLYDDGDFTNAFGFFIEVGIALFISILLFRYSNTQQHRSSAILDQVSNATQKLAQISDTLEEQRKKRKAAELDAITYVLTSVWVQAQSALFVICENGFKEPDADDVLSDSVRASLGDYKRNIARALEQLNNVLLLGKDDLDAELLSALLQLHAELKFRISSESSIGRLAHPWSGCLSVIHDFSKSSMPSLKPSLWLPADHEKYLPEEIRKKIKES